MMCIVLWVHIDTRDIDNLYYILNVQMDSCVFWDSLNLKTEASCSTKIQRNDEASHLEFEGKGRFISPSHVEIHHENFSVGADEKTVNCRLKLALRAGVKNASIKQSKDTDASGSHRLGQGNKRNPRERSQEACFKEGRQETPQPRSMPPRR